MLRKLPRKGLMATCLTLLILAWVLLLNSFVAKADSVSVSQITCQTPEFSPNVDLQVRVAENGASLNMILTGEDGEVGALSYSQAPLTQDEVRSLLEKKTAEIRLNDPISGDQLLSLDKGNGHILWTTKRDQKINIQISNCQ